MADFFKGPMNSQTSEARMRAAENQLWIPEKPVNSNPIFDAGAMYSMATGDDKVS